MIAALVVVVLVTATDATSAQTSGVSRALEEALEPGSVVLLRSSPALREDADLSAIAVSARADAAVVVTWAEGEGGRAHLRVQRAGARTAAERDIDFKPSDASIERGKTVGFAIASMLPSIDTPTHTPNPRVAEPETPSHDQPTAALPWSVDLAVATTLGVGGDADGFGGTLALRRDLTSLVDARAALTITRGSVSAAQASLTLVRPRAGIGIALLRQQAVAARVRIESGPWLHAVDRAGTGRTEGARWVPGAEAVIEIAWTIAPRVALTFDAGLDIAFGTTRVIVGDEERTSIPPVRAVGDVGVRVPF